jgi:hypothetical protein
VSCPVFVYVLHKLQIKEFNRSKIQSSDKDDSLTLLFLIDHGWGTCEIDVEGGWYW